jgi:hypothetical protein
VRHVSARVGPQVVGREMSTAAAPAVPSAVFACDVCGLCPVQDFVYRCSVCKVWGALRGRWRCAAASRPRADGRRPHAGSLLQRLPAACGRAGRPVAQLLAGAARRVARAHAAAGAGVHRGAAAGAARPRRPSCAVNPKRSLPVGLPLSRAPPAQHSGRLSAVVGNAVQRWCARRSRSCRRQPLGALHRRCSSEIDARRALPLPRFCETMQAAKGGDVNSMELLSQMLNEGYGCQRDSTLVRLRCFKEAPGAVPACSRASLCMLAGALLAQRGAEPRRAATRRCVRQAALGEADLDGRAPACKQSATRAASCNARPHAPMPARICSTPRVPPAISYAC